MPSLDALKNDLLAVQKRARAQEAHAAENWKRASEIQKEIEERSK